MDSDKYLEGQSMQRPPLFESDIFIYWKNRFEAYVKSKDLDLWHVSTNDDFQPIQNNLETKLDEVVPFEKQNDDLKKRLAKNNKAKMVIYNALPRKEYERIFSCIIWQKIWKTLLIIHQVKVTTSEESKDLTSLSLDELIENLKVHEMIIKKDSKIVKAKGERKSLALKAKKESSDKDCSTSGNDKNVKSDRKCFRCGDPNHLIGECPKPPKDKNQRAFVGGSWSDSYEEDDEKAKDETCLMAHTLKVVRNSLENDKTKDTQMTPKAIEGSPVCSPNAEKSVSFQKSILCPRPKHIMVNNVKIPVASDDEVKRFYKPSLKPEVGFSKPNFRSKSPPHRRVNNSYPRSKTPQPKRNIGLQNRPHGFPICLGVDLEPVEWIKDSGCSKHMTGNRKLFSTYKAYNGDNVEHVDNLRFNLLSVGRSIRKSGLYVMKLEKKPKDKVCLTTIVENSTLWHRRLGHANMHLIQSLASKELVRNLSKLKSDQHFYDACKIRKQAHASHKAKNIVSTTRCLELLHMVLFGPSVVRSYGGNLYTLVIVDDYSRYTWTIFLKNKTEAFEKFKMFSRKIN
ncbi:zf-CCHC domain-containing protein [Tanacetum coccineum]